MKFLLVLLFTLSAIPISVQASDKPLHHLEDGFQNYPLTEPPPTLGIGFYLQRVWDSFILPVVPEKHFLTEDKAIKQYQRFEKENTLTWIGQSTFLIKINNKTILTDPFFSDYAGPFSMGPRRFVDPGISPDNLPSIDILLISHNHYDHLDEDFIDQLPNKKEIHVFVPLNLKQFFEEKGYKHIHELDWNESFSIYGFKFFALPSVHYSGRGFSDKNKSLWCSWSIAYSGGNLYFAGDTAYSSSIFKEIGKKFQSFDTALLTIGTYGNRKYGVNNHTTPEEAIEMGKDLNANMLVGMHWGTIQMSDEPVWEAPVRFEEAALKDNISSERIWIMKIGETRILPSNANSNTHAINGGQLSVSE